MPKRLVFYLEMRQGIVYLQCWDDDNASVEGHICFKALEELTLTSSWYNLPASNPYWNNSPAPPHSFLLFGPWDIIIFYQCVYIKSFEGGCQFGNEIVCARESFRLEINGTAIKTWELQYLVTIMIMALAGGINFTSGVGGCRRLLAYAPCWKASSSIPLPPSVKTYFSFF